MIMKHFDLIYKFVHGELEESELWEFRKRLSSDPILARELKQFEQIIQTNKQVEKLDVLDSLNSIHQRNEQSVIKTLFIGYYKVAAAAAILILMTFATFWFIQSKIHDANSQLYAAYFSHENSMFTVRSSTANMELPVIQGIQYYELKDFSSAVEMFEKAPSNLLAKLYGGLSYMELDEFDKAINQFQQIIHHNDNLFIDQSEWYLGLCYLKTNKLNEARLLFEKISLDNSIYKTKAQKLLKEMKN
jgi:tetratricopeptide (TPR) repeat protein